ncbi:V-set and transmembrane domain-containing protein 5-like isoform X2 [Mobula birostris]
MSGLPFAALVLCLCITAGQSQQFTIFVEHSQIKVTVGGDALFSVRPSGNVSSGDWIFKGETIAQWINQTVTVDKAYTSRAYVFISNGSLLLKSLNMSDNGEYRVTIVPTNGSRTSATIFLRVIEKTDGKCILSSGAILGIVVFFLGVIMIGVVSGWLITRNTDGIKDPPQSKHDTSTNSRRKSTLDTNAADASENYENFPRNEQGTRNNADDGNSTYMGLVLQDRSVYSDLKR